VKKGRKKRGVKKKMGRKRGNNGGEERGGGKKGPEPILEILGRKRKGFFLQREEVNEGMRGKKSSIDGKKKRIFFGEEKMRTELAAGGKGGGHSHLGRGEREEKKQIRVSWRFHKRKGGKKKLEASLTWGYSP